MTSVATSRTNSYEEPGNSSWSTHGSTITAQRHQNYQRFLVADPVAFRYLEEDRSTRVLEAQRDLEGYQLYLIEQWACARTHPTFIIAAYTGNAAHTIKVGVLSVPADEEAWSPRLRVYFKTLSQYYARRKETPLGILMVTNLGGFPSSLTIVQVPGGDVYKHREDFFVNENLKRLGCSGRVGLTVAEPSTATQAKFYQLYKISDKIPLYSAVIGLVKLCQAALMLFGCLEPEYVDGLLCDFTERAINDWWNKIGTDLYNVQATDGVLSPTTVAALLGTVIGARNRLNAYGVPVAKDVFEVEATKRAIGSFQKAQRLPKSRRLDMQTLDRLHKTTIKQASGDGWNMPRAVKSTVAELSGKGGEMVMDIVGRGEKTTIADIETIDIERFATLVKGERARWLWHAEARKRTTRDLFSGTLGEDPLAPQKSRSTEENGEADLPSKRTVLGRAKGRIKGAVGLRGHSYTTSKDSDSFYNHPNKSAESSGSASMDDTASPSSTHKLDDWIVTRPAAPRLNTSEQAKESAPTFTEMLTHTPVRSQRSFPPQSAMNGEHEDEKPELSTQTVKPVRKRISLKEAYSPIAELDIPQDDRLGEDIGIPLRRTRSASRLKSATQKMSHENRWPRQLSFSAAEDMVFVTKGFTSPVEGRDVHWTTKQSLAQELLRAEDSRRLRETIATIGADVASWVERKIAGVEELSIMASEDAEQLNGLYYPRRDEYHSLQEGSQEIVGEERSRLQEAVKDLETLGAKLEYEINALKGKVEEVEEAVTEFEKQVKYTEDRVTELIKLSNREGWVQWLVRIMTRGEKQTVLIE